MIKTRSFILHPNHQQKRILKPRCKLNRPFTYRPVAVKDGIIHGFGYRYHYVGVGIRLEVGFKVQLFQEVLYFKELVELTADL